jgi:hypothetical protein
VLKNASRLAKVEMTLGALSGLLGVVTLFWRDWIEVTGWDPDHHNGTVEWLIAGGLILLAITLGSIARRGMVRQPSHAGA